MIETEEQRRWWFATHPEYSWSRSGQGRNRGGPHKSEKDPVTRQLLRLTKRWFGTEEQTAESREEEDYKNGFNDGYWAIHRRQAPPDLDPADRSPYAQGVRHGAEKALDDKERWAQQWLDPLSMLLGTHPSRTLGRNLEKAGISKPSSEHHAHHIVEWRHWKADPARQVLEKYGIDLHGADNGMWLHRTYHYPLANSYRYIDTVNHILQKAGETGSKAEVLKALDGIRHSLSSGKFPL